MKGRLFLVTCIATIMCGFTPVWATSGVAEGYRCSPEDVMESEYAGYTLEDDYTYEEDETLYYGEEYTDDEYGYEGDEYVDGRAEGVDDVSASFDDEFEKDVRNELGLNSNEPIPKDRCASVEEITVSKGVKYLKGIENFKNLKKLTIQSSRLSAPLTVDNYPILKQVRWLDIRESRLGSKLNFSGMSKLQVLQADGCNRTDTINFTGCKNLKQVYMRNVEGIDKFKNLPSGIEVLDLTYCSVYDGLELADYPNLKYLWLTGGGDIDEIAGLDRLVYLEYSDSYPDELVIRDCPNLNSIVAVECCTGKLKLSNLDSCVSVDCVGGELRSLTISNCPSMRLIDCRDNMVSKLSFTGCNGVDVLRCSSNNLRKLDVSMLPNLQDLDCTENYMSSIKKVKGRSNSMQVEGSRFFFSPQKPLQNNMISCKVSSLNLKAGKGTYLEVYGAPERSATRYKSSNPSICKVDNKGNVTALRKGRAVITISNNGGSDCASKKIKIPVRVVNKNKLGTVQNVKVSKTGSIPVKVKWSKVKGAKKYIIKYSYNKDFHSYVIERSTGTSIQLRGVSKNRKLYVMVRACNVSGQFADYGNWSTVVSS